MRLRKRHIDLETNQQYAERKLRESGDILFICSIINQSVTGWMIENPKHGATESLLTRPVGELTGLLM